MNHRVGGAQDGVGAVRAWRNVAAVGLARPARADMFSNAVEVRVGQAALVKRGELDSTGTASPSSFGTF
jgi:hypothetical protein